MIALLIATRPLGAVEIPIDHDLRGDTIYRVMVSRFNNGNPDNDFYCRERIERGDPHWRGDFEGLIRALPYLQDLGFTAILISPPIDNRGALDYHGGYGYDWLRPDPRLESPGGTYRDFIREAHLRGIKVIQTLIVNHSSNYGIRNRVWINRLPHKYYRASDLNVPWPYEIVLGNYRWPFRDDNDNPKAPDWFWERSRRDPFGGEPLLDRKTGETVPKLDYRPDRFFGTDEADLDPNWYHRNGFAEADDLATVAGLQGKHLDGDCIDLATENDTVRRYLAEVARQYLAWGVDGFNLEFARNVDRLELLRMLDDWRPLKPGLVVLADVANLGPGWGDPKGDDSMARTRPWWYSRSGNDPVDPDAGGWSHLWVHDYPLFSSFNLNLAEGSFAGLADVFKQDWIWGDPTRVITFFQNHRFGPSPDLQSRFDGEMADAALAYNLLWTVRGVPCLWQGEEIAFQAGAPQDLVNDPDLLLSGSGRAYFGDHLLATTIAQTQSHPLYLHIQRLNAIRRRIPALQRAPMSGGRIWDTGMSFVRDWRLGESYVVVGLAAEDQEITVAPVRSGRYVDAITGLEQVVATDSLSLTFEVAGYSMGVWVRDGPGQIGSAGPWLR